MSWLYPIHHNCRTYFQNPSGQTAAKQMRRHPDLAATERLLISDSFDLGQIVPDRVRLAVEASEAYRLFFVFENYLREIIVRALSRDGSEAWWDKVPPEIQVEVKTTEETEEMKAWMALGSRDRSALMTYPQLLRIVEANWKEYFEDLLRDKALIQEARHIGHLRNTICHMTAISPEEMQRVRQVIRDWFRIVAP